jgi:hypothetical protein
MKKPARQKKCLPERESICAARGLACNPKSQRCVKSTVHPAHAVDVLTRAKVYWHTGVGLPALVKKAAAAFNTSPEIVILVFGMILASLLRLDAKHARRAIVAVITSMKLMAGNVRGYVTGMWTTLVPGPPPPPPPPSYIPSLPMPPLPSLQSIASWMTAPVVAMLMTINGMPQLIALVFKYPTVAVAFLILLYKMISDGKKAAKTYNQGQDAGTNVRKLTKAGMQANEQKEIAVGVLQHKQRQLRHLAVHGTGQNKNRYIEQMSPRTGNDATAVLNFIKSHARHTV